MTKPLSSGWDGGLSLHQQGPEGVELQMWRVSA